MEEPILKYVAEDAAADVREGAVKTITTQLRGGTSIIQLVRSSSGFFQITL